MTIKEIRAMKVEQREILNNQHEEHNEFVEASQRNLADLDVQELKVHDKLVQRIKRHFQGVKVNIIVSETQVKITVGEQFIFEYLYNDWSFEHISRKLAKIITDEYNAVYGDISKEKEYSLYSSIYARAGFGTDYFTNTLPDCIR